jgi:hypothetical protein
MMKRAKAFFEQLGVPVGDRHDLPRSDKRFPDGAQYRIEIPSVEGIATLNAVLEESQKQDVLIHRISQGSGMMLLREAEMREIAKTSHDNQIEACLFVGPRAAWEGSAQSLTPDGKIFGWRHMGMDQLLYAFEDVLRGIDCGIRSILVADEGLTWLIGQGREKGIIPENFVVKASALMGLSNPIGIKLMVDAGIDTINVASNITLPQLATIRQITDKAIDLYIEGPDGLGGFTRYYELPEIIRVGAPIYLKFGLRNAPGIYPSGYHIEPVSIQQGRERVRRAAIGMEILKRISEEDYQTSQRGAEGLGIGVLS